QFHPKKTKKPNKSLAIAGDLCYSIMDYGAVNYSLSFDARGCDTLGCIATQHRVGFLVELAYYLK
ncbi:TPA: hypothetical protein ACL1WG_000117, partial [Streptococcus pneumoniae]